MASTSESALEQGGIDDAIALWENRGVRMGHATGAATIEIVFEPASQAFHGVYDDEHGVIHINDGLSDPAELAIVIAHEVGHAFGLVHVSDRVSLMNKGNLVTPPTEEDRYALESLWGACMPPAGQ